MFDAKRLLGQFIASKVGGGSRGGFGSSGSHGFGGGGGSPLEGIARSIGANPALAGGLASLILGSKKGRKLGGSAFKLGGMALVGSLAFKAFQNWQNSQGQGGQPSGGGYGAGGGASFLPRGGTPHGGNQPGAFSSGFAGGGAPSGASAPSPWTQQAPPSGTPFAPAAEDEQQRLSRMLLVAMIAAAKADGHIDATEQAAIFGKMDEASLDPDDKAFVLDELRAPVDLDAVARSARNPEEAAEIYAASLLAIDVDNASERDYLGALAARLNLPDDLVAHLHATIEDAARAEAA